MSDGSTGGTPPAWHAGLDPEVLGHVTSRGWDKLDPATAALEAAKAHVSATKMIGVPAEQLLRMPKDPAADPDGMKAVWQRLGAPADAAGYEFEGINIGEDTPAMIEALRNTAAGANLPKAAAAQVAKGMADWVNAQTAAFNETVEANRVATETALKKSWGADFAIHDYTANQGKTAIAARLGERLAPDLDKALNHLTDFGMGEVARELLRVIGAGLTEDAFKGNSTGAAGGRVPPNREQAQLRLAELQRDPQWVQKFLAGGSQERAEKKQLDVIIAGVSE